MAHSDEEVTEAVTGALDSVYGGPVDVDSAYADYQRRITELRAEGRAAGRCARIRAGVARVRMLRAKSAGDTVD